MELHISANSKELNQSLADWIRDYILEVLVKQDRFTFVLSGGSTPKQLYALLANLPYSQDIPWKKVHFFWGDERFVPFADDRNNAKMAYDELLNQIDVLPEHIHVMKTDVDPQDSVASYEKTLKTYFGETGNTFDLVLLGMGDDGHTLSLFPGTEVVHESKAWVHAFFLPAQDMYRITLTAPVVNRASAVVFAAAGQGKADTLKNVLEGERNIDVFPSQIIDPINGSLHWFVDQAAAEKLRKN
ncbi:6-phosphogluconolactonase [Dyadobacter sp. CECT 9275]|uniref:6-phosphogluconolactonase n=1 Tax=Dyadobacter helix TaxID=2822344 RepID=A0A916N500_9BACT|nr:6-phosphogluconolactonase [Dyadobacter sp. CECT 9275]CAG5003043.1 6-phosphogluconolactonase [Dyadobacter sp. CECT 9275]